MLSVPDHFHTKRLVLRIPTPDDAEEILHTYANDAEVTRFLTWSPVSDLADIRLGLTQRVERHHNGEEFSWVIISPDSGVLMGMITIRQSGFFAEMGYVLGTSFWGQGYATEALEALSSWIVQKPDIVRVWASCDVDNLASARVLEKAGFVREGILHDWSVSPGISPETRDSYYYARMKSRIK